jgi:antirestriction protein ArdC
MTRDEALKRTNTALDELAAALEQGRSQQLTEYLRLLGRFHRYSASNVLMIFVQRPDATHVAGFHAWLKLGRHVRKGEKGIAILAPMIGRLRSKQPDVESPDGDSPRTIRGFRVAHVFDVAQTDGKPLPGFAQVHGSPDDHLVRLRQFIRQQGIVLHQDFLPGKARGASMGGGIIVRPDLPPAEMFAVLAHELAHELLHVSPDGTQLSLTQQETEAEATAFVVAGAIGLHGLAHSRDYIQLYRGNRQTLAESLQRIQQTATTILQGITEAESPLLDESIATGTYPSAA